MDMRSNSFLLAAARVVSYLPPALYFPLTFRSWARFLDDSEYWSAEQLGNYQIRKLKSILQLCAQRVPFYRLLFQTIGFDPDKFEHISQIQVLPLLDQETVQLQLEDFIAEGTPPRQIRAHSTGGTLGQPMSFRNVRSSVFRDQAFMFHQWKRVAFVPRICGPCCAVAWLRIRDAGSMTPTNGGTFFPISTCRQTT